MDNSAATEKPEWKPDQSAIECTSCKAPFTLIRRRHHCRKCGSIFCDPCSNYYSILPAEYGYTGQQRLCRSCHSFFEQKRQFYDNDAIVAQLQLRSSANYEYSKPLVDIGNTKNGLRKSYILSKCASSGDEILITIISPNTTTCPWPMNSEKHKQKFIKTMLALKNKYIYPISTVEIAGSNDKVFIFRKFCQKGSLKDIIYKTKPTNAYDSKYSSSLKKSYSSGVTVKLMPKYGRQILEALLYLKQRGIIFTHLHSGNILFNNDCCYLSEIENCLLGLKPFYHDVINGKENPEVICFGYILFESIVGVPLVDLQISSYASVIPEPIMDVLKFIFPSDKPSPSLEELIKHTYFAQIKMEDNSTTDGKLKKSQLAFIKEYSNRMESLSSPRGPSVLKKQASSTSMLSDHHTSSTSSTTSTAYQPPSLSTIAPKASTSSNNLLKSNKLTSSNDLNQFKVTPKAPVPPPAPPIGKAPAPPPPPPVSRSGGSDRKGLLSSIEGFKAGSLKKTKTNDRSKPKV